MEPGFNDLPSLVEGLQGRRFQPSQHLYSECHRLWPGAGEVGAKSELLDRHLRLNAAVFYTKYDDLQVSVIQPSTTAGIQTITDNAGKADYRGGELEITVLPATG